LCFELSDESLGNGVSFYWQVREHEKEIVNWEGWGPFSVSEIHGGYSRHFNYINFTFSGFVLLTCKMHEKKKCTITYAG
jgi:hypothetical protein